MRRFLTRQTRTTLTTDSQSNTDTRADGPGSRARIRLLALLVLTVFFAGAVLFVKLKLEDLRTVFEAEAERRTGIDLGIGAIQVSGLKGLIIQDFHTTLPVPDGPSVDLMAPALYVYINIIDLMYGQITIDRIQLDDATIAVHKPAGAPWIPAKAGRDKPVPLTDEDGAPVPPPPPAPTGKAEVFPKGTFSNTLAFRVLGKNCMLRVNNVVGDTSLEVHKLDFDVLRLTDSTDFTVKLAGLLAGDEQKPISMNARFSSLEDFDFRAQCGTITSEDVNVFLPAAERFVEAGALRASLRVAGYPGQTVVVSMEVPVEGLRLRGQPAFLDAVSGGLTALGNYHLDSRVLTLTTAQAVTSQFSGRVEGKVSFAGEAPEFDLKLHATELPVNDALQFGMNSALESAGQALKGLQVELKEPYAIDVRLQGTPADPQIIASAELSEGKLAYRTKVKNMPQVDLNFGRVNLAWDSRTGAPKGSLTVFDGVVDHAATGIKAEKLRGTLSLTPAGVVLDGLNAEVRGNPFVGRAEFSNETKEVTFTASGVVAGLENTPLGSEVKDLSLAGSVAVRCTGKVSKEHQTFDVALDGTQAAVGFEWWLRKPVGVGLGINGVNVNIAPGKSMTITGNALLDTVPLSGNFEFIWQKVKKGAPEGKWTLNHITAKSDLVNVDSVDKCLNIQYQLSGKPAKDMKFEWTRTEKGLDTKVFSVGGHIEEVHALPVGGTLPITVRDAEILVTVEDGAGTDRTGFVEVNTKHGTMPPVGQTWFVDLEPPDVKAIEDAKNEPPRLWTYEAKGEKIDVPPWEGGAFVVRGKSDDKFTHIAPFEATVGEGKLKGSYDLENDRNIGTLKATWDGVPVKYMLRHLNFPEVITGKVTGEVDYTMDQDDPGTLKGTGKFDVQDGEFNWDVLQQQFKNSIAADMASMPSRKFSHFKMDVQLEGDKVTTKNVSLEAEGVTVTGDGTYVTEGDMDYLLKVAISPATAERIPLMKSYFNIEGHRLTQNNIELTFHVNGPAFNPTGSVKGLPPVGVTLVSGAAELTSEALKVIDLPRKILLDLFKIGGAVAVQPK